MVAQADDVYRQQGFGHTLGIAGRLGLLIVDFTVGFADPAVFGGGNIPAAIAGTVPMLAFARVHGWPIAHTRVVYADDGSDGNVFTLKVPSMLGLTEHASSGAIVPELTPRPGELVIRKTLPSAFFATTLAAWLTFHKVGTLAIAGCTTSGCVRASVLDAMCLGFRPMVLSDCVGDRALGPHEANLFDMQQKYADVITAADLITAVAQIGDR